MMYSHNQIALFECLINAYIRSLVGEKTLHKKLKAAAIWDMLQILKLFLEMFPIKLELSTNIIEGELPLWLHWVCLLFWQNTSRSGSRTFSLLGCCHMKYDKQCPCCTTFYYV